ncbi:DEAD/DEAH box helicase [Xylophilus sp.]|uniref:DEAD/DEAH box helicase n=1 Tax=Xylophilus sp. TaxID=2653893 RepID=UPI0013BC6CA0|nr:DEAD/DEAH box helicase [Xylophilus sp.]KAF1047056.1 MAG: ATP-dependent RNA helicase RhlE [Xylophilus sp.]
MSPARPPEGARTAGRPAEGIPARGFNSLGLAAGLGQAAADAGFATPTAVQAQAIPPALAGADLLATAPTGSGKTAAFALPLLQRLLRPAAAGQTPSLRALVLVPTRELAHQAGTVLRDLARQLQPRPRIAVAFGGVSINPQLMALRGGTDATVATPGRLLDLVEHNALTLSQVELLVLDEADRLLDLGFAGEFDRVLSLLPARRQSLFFSATFAPPVQALAHALLRQPVRVDVRVNPGVDAPADRSPHIHQRAIAVDAPRRTQLLRQLLADETLRPAMVFVATKHAAGAVAGKLYQAGIYAAAFHGDLSQGTRTEVLAELRAGRWDAVVTTDLAARGIDVAQLPLVVNYDLPRSADDYVHRIGRTGRAGGRGQAISFVSAATEAHWRLIARRQRLALPLEQVAGFEPAETAPPPATAARADGSGMKGRRPSRKDRLRAAAGSAQVQAADGPAPPSGSGSGSSRNS